MLEAILIGIFIIFYLFLAYKNLTLAIFLIIAALPSYQIRFEVLSIPFTILEVMILALFIVWLIRVLKNHLVKNIELGEYKLPLFILILASIFALFVTPNFIDGAGVWKAYIIEPILFFIVFINTIKTRVQKKIILSALGILVLYISLIAIIQFITGWNIPDPWQVIENRRATSLFPYPNAVGLLLAPICTLFIGLILQKSKIFKTKTLAIGILITIAILGILSSKTEGALIAILAGFIFFVLFLKWRWVIIACLFISFGVLLIIPITNNHIENILLFRDVSGDVHLALWEGTYDLLKENFITGSGLGGFPDIYEKYKLAKHTELLLYPHNIFLNWWVELGILGLISLIWLIILFIKNNISTIKNKTNSKKLAICLIGVMITIIIYGLVDVPYFKNDLAILFWTIIGLGYVIKNNPQTVA